MQSMKQTMAGSEQFLIPSIALIAMAALLVSTSLALPPHIAAGYQLSWSDEFYGTTLNPCHWKALDIKRLDGQFKKQKVSVRDGRLILTTATSNNIHYTGGVSSEGKLEPTFGYFEARCRLKPQNGMWVGFWLQSLTNGDVIGNSYASGSEIDVYEYRKTAPKLHASYVHWDGYGSAHKFDFQKTVVDALGDGQFHTFGLEWTERFYRFYLDDRLMWQTDSGLSGRPEFLNFTNEVLIGRWAGYPSYRVISNASHEVDYVRLYKKKLNQFSSATLSEGYAAGPGAHYLWKSGSLPAGWNTIAGSDAVIDRSKNGTISAKMYRSTDEFSIGLHRNEKQPANASPWGMDYHLRVNGYGRLYAYEGIYGNPGRHYLGRVVPGDKLSVERQNGNIRYKLNQLIKRSIAESTASRGSELRGQVHIRTSKTAVIDPTLTAESPRSFDSKSLLERRDGSNNHYLLKPLEMANEWNAIATSKNPISPYGTGVVAATLTADNVICSIGLLRNTEDVSANPWLMDYQLYINGENDAFSYLGLYDDEREYLGPVKVGDQISVRRTNIRVDFLINGVIKRSIPEPCWTRSFHLRRQIHIKTAGTRLTSILP